MKLQKFVLKMLKSQLDDVGFFVINMSTFTIIHSSIFRDGNGDYIIDLWPGQNIKSVLPIFLTLILCIIMQVSGCQLGSCTANIYFPLL